MLNGQCCFKPNLGWLKGVLLNEPCTPAPCRRMLRVGLWSRSELLCYSRSYLLTFVFVRVSGILPGLCFRLPVDLWPWGNLLLFPCQNIQRFVVSNNISTSEPTRLCFTGAAISSPGVGNVSFNAAKLWDHLCGLPLFPLQRMGTKDRSEIRLRLQWESTF